MTPEQRADEVNQGMSDYREVFLSTSRGRRVLKDILWLLGWPGTYTPETVLLCNAAHALLARVGILSERALDDAIDALVAVHDRAAPEDFKEEI